MDRIASCKWAMTAAKILLLFAMFCYFLFSKRQFMPRKLVR